MLCESGVNKSPRLEAGSLMPVEAHLGCILPLVGNV
jgi:hypothetical protein